MLAGDSRILAHTGKWRAAGGEERNDTREQVKQTLSSIRSVGRMLSA